MSKDWNDKNLKDYLNNRPGVVERSISILLKSDIQFSQKELKILDDSAKQLAIRNYLFGTMFTKAKYICNKHIAYLVQYANTNKNVNK